MKLQYKNLENPNSIGNKKYKKKLSKKYIFIKFNYNDNKFITVKKG